MKTTLTELIRCGIWAFRSSRRSKNAKLPRLLRLRAITRGSGQPLSSSAPMWTRTLRERTTALLVGSYVDAHFEGTLDLFKARNPEIFTKKGDLKSEYRQAENIINRIERDPLFMFFMSGEKQVIMTGSVEGVPVKIKIDSYHPGKMIVDLKVMRDFKPIYVEEKGRMSWIEAWGYDLQGAVYQEIVRQNTGLKLPFFIAAATKESEPDIDIIEIPQAYLDVELERFKENVAYYDSLKEGYTKPERCEKCDYCKATKVL